MKVGYPDMGVLKGGLRCYPTISPSHLFVKLYLGTNGLTNTFFQGPTFAIAYPKIVNDRQFDKTLIVRTSDWHTDLDSVH